MTPPNIFLWNPLKAKKQKLRDKPHRRESEAHAARGITKMVAWFARRGYEVRFGRQMKDAIFPDLKRVTICSRPSLSSQLVSLLHEAGHILLNANPSYNERFGKGWNFVGSKNVKVLDARAHRVQVLEEEIEAWNRGRSLSGRLRISVDEKLWSRIKYWCLTRYSHYASQKQVLITVPVSPA